MKKVFSVSTIFVLMLFITGCNKKVLTIDKYTSIMDDFGYTNEVLDFTKFSDEFVEDDPMFEKTKDIDTTINSIKDGSQTKCSINIYDNEDHAIKATNLKPYTNDIPSMSEEKCMSKDNYDKCVRVFGTDYVVHIRVANTFLYCSAKVSDRDVLDKIIKKLGY